MPIVSFHLDMIKQFLESVDWGNLDYLIIDTPPGTSDEHMAIVEYLQQKNPTAIIVTTPQVIRIYDRVLNFVLIFF